MASVFKCPQCGGVLKDDSRFCNYCGAKIDDGVKRTEVRIEDVADMKRAGFQEQESLLYQKKVQAQFKREKVKRIAALSLLGFFLVFAIIGRVVEIQTTQLGLIVLCTVSIWGALGMIAFIVYQLLTGKW